MIHQCYFLAEQRPRLFGHLPYSPFGLEPEIYPSLLNNCPELAAPEARLALVEYGAMLHHWRNPTLDGDAWIGFTSYRQLDKSPVVFGSKDEVEERLDAVDLVAWYVWDVSRVRLGWLRGAAAQAELSSPRLHVFTNDVLRAFNITIPAAYFDGTDIVFANYWAMSREKFTDFMTWSWPIIQHAMHIDHPYKTHAHALNALDHKGKCVGYFMERLFVVWTKLRRLKTAVVGPVVAA